MEKSIIADSVSAITSDQALTAKDSGFRFARNQLENIENARDFSRMIGTDPTYDQFEACRVQWVAGYVEANPDNTANSADKAWGRFTGLLDDLFGLKVVKPKSDNPAAEKKRAEREKKNADLLAKYQDSNPAELRAQIEHAYTVLSQNPTHKESLKQVKELDKVLKVKQSAANKQFGEELSELRKEVKEAVTKCTQPEALQACLDILEAAATE